MVDLLLQAVYLAEGGLELLIELVCEAELLKHSALLRVRLTEHWKYLLSHHLNRNLWRDHCLSRGRLAI
jgi:hypothetical protein